MLVNQPTSNPSSYILPRDSQGRFRSCKLQIRAVPRELVGDLLTSYSSLSRDPIQLVMPMKLFVRCVGSLATGGGSVLVVTSFQALPDSFFVCLRGLGISKFVLLWRLTNSLAELSFWEMVTGTSRTRGTLAIWAHTRRQRECITGFLGLFFFWLRFTVYRLF